ncbi:hypothetical protein GQ53DRAFT_56114 [Thozetella sp. PMI_491]|nr:hypothetical protein GQ53DRAFT_56114 [Thozetella sp. PMI_491]
MADDSNSAVIYDLVIESSVLLESIVRLEARWHDANPSLARRDDAPSLVDASVAGLAPSPQTGSKVQQADDDGEGQLPRVMKALGQSFEIWTKYTGALADVGLSLDDRLRDHPDIHSMVVDMLKLMKTNLGRLEGQLAGRGKLQHTPKSFETRRRWIDVVRDGDKMDPAAESQAAVAEAMDSLHFIASAIRRSSAQPLKYALSTKFARKDESYWEQYAILYVRRFFPDARPGLVRQLGAAIAVRRKRLFGRKRHDEKLASKRDTKARNTSSIKAKKPSPSVENDKDGKDGLAVPAPAGPGLPRTFQPSTVFSELDEEKAYERLRSRPQLTYVSSVRSDSSTMKLQHQYPPAPAFKESDYHQACPYCSRGLETSKLKVPKYWEKHVDEDLQPYVCISEYCSQRLQFFNKKDQWLDHMRSIHSNEWVSKVHMRTWYCDVDHDLVQFNDQADFEAHLKDTSIHPRTPTDAQLASLVRKKSQLLPREDFSCPLCENIPKNVETLLKNSPETARYTLHRHIALHLRDLAFISLPMAAEDQQEEGDKESVLDEQSSRRRQRKDDSSVSLPSGYSDVEDVDLNFEEASYLKSMADVESDVPASEVTDWSRFALEPHLNEPNDPIIAHFGSLQHQICSSKKREDNQDTAREMPGFLKLTSKGMISIPNTSLWFYAELTV